jgi:hypothetical protein
MNQIFNMKITRHKWDKVDYAFKTWRCSKCSCIRYWDMIFERIVFIKGSKQLYTTPDCNSVINCN